MYSDINIAVSWERSHSWSTRKLKMREMMPHIPVKKFTVVQLPPCSGTSEPAWGWGWWVLTSTPPSLTTRGCWANCGQVSVSSHLSVCQPVRSAPHHPDDTDRSVSISGGSGRATSYDIIKKNFSRFVNYLDLSSLGNEVWVTGDGGEWQQVPDLRHGDILRGHWEGLHHGYSQGCCRLGLCAGQYRPSTLWRRWTRTSGTRWPALRRITSSCARWKVSKSVSEMK